MLEKKKNTKENLGEESYRDIIDPNPSNNPELRTLAKNESSAMKTYLERLPLKSTSGSNYALHQRNESRRYL